MIPTQGRDSTLDPYYFAGQLGNLSQEEFDTLQEEIEQLQNIVIGTELNPGLQDQVRQLEEAVAELQRDGARIQFGTTDYWEEHKDDTSYLRVIYVYADEVEGQLVQKIKIGDGVTTIGALPFVAQSDAQTVTQEEKDRWNNKVSCSFDSENENLILTTDD